MSWHALSHLHEPMVNGSGNEWETECGWEPGANRAEQGSGGLGSRLHGISVSQDQLSNGWSWIRPESGSQLNPVAPQGRGGGTYSFWPFAHSVLNPIPTIHPSPSHVPTSEPLHLLFLLPENPFPSSSSLFSPNCVGSSPNPTLLLSDPGKCFTSLLAVLNFPSWKMQMVMTVMTPITKLMRL